MGKLIKDIYGIFLISAFDQPSDGRLTRKKSWRNDCSSPTGRNVFGPGAGAGAPGEHGRGLRFQQRPISSETGSACASGGSSHGEFCSSSSSSSSSSLRAPRPSSGCSVAAGLSLTRRPLALTVPLAPHSHTTAPPFPTPLNSGGRS